MNKPQIGEYWWTKYHGDYIIVEIIDTMNGFSCFTSHGVIYVHDLIHKWKPNRFWKILGYK